MSTELANYSFTHAITAIRLTKEALITKEAIITKEIHATCKTEQDPFIFINTLARYTSKEFCSIMINTRASCRLTAGYKQYIAYKKINNIKINTL